MIRYGETVISLLFMLSGFFFLVGSTSIARVSDGAALFPRALSIFLIVLSVMNIRRTVRNKKAEALLQGIKVQRKLVSGILISLLYLYLIPKTGYFLITPVYTIALLYAQGYRNITRILCVTAGFMGVAYFLFYKLLSVYLPV